MTPNFAHQCYVWCLNLSPCRAAGAAALLVWACGAEPPASTSVSSDPGDDRHVLSPLGECQPENLTAACACQDQGSIPGAKTCRNGVWSECNCRSEATQVVPDGSGGSSNYTEMPAAVPAVDSATPVGDPPGNSSSNRFDWERTPFEVGSCKAGHYLGNFTGMYGSPAV
ncbi:hypothetical protein ACFL5O_11675, partial [Myxococcota bacterium]